MLGTVFPTTCKKPLWVTFVPGEAARGPRTPNFGVHPSSLKRSPVGCGQSRDSGDREAENCSTDGELIELCLLATLRSALAPLEALCRNMSSSATLASSHFPGRCPFQNTKKAGSPALNAGAKKLSSAFPPSIR